MKITYEDENNIFIDNRFIKASRKRGYADDK